MKNNNADKGRERCACTKHLKFIENENKWVCNCPSDCFKCSPKPQANVGDSWEVEFDKEFVLDPSQYLGMPRQPLPELKAVKSFISNLLSTTSAQKLESLERSVEGLENYYGNPKEEKMVYLTAVLDIIRKQK